MKTKLYDVLNRLLCLAPMVFIVCNIAYPLYADIRSPGCIETTYGLLLLFVMTVFCLFMTLTCVLLRFLLYVIEHHRLSEQYPERNPFISFAHEPYHNIPERASDVVMTVQAFLALLIAMFYLRAGGPVW